MANPLARVLVALLLLLASVAWAGEGLVNTNVIRRVDLGALPFVKEQIGVVVQNEHASKAIRSYVVVVPLAKQAQLASIDVHERKSGAELLVERQELDGHRYVAKFHEPLQPGQKISLNIDLTLLSSVEPRPAVVSQTGDQTWVWTDNVLVTSAYPTRKQKTVVQTRGDIRRVTEVAETKKERRSVTFGPYTDSRDQEVEVHFQDNTEQLEALTHRREYFVSHWADDLNVLEHYVLRNRAPKVDAFDKVKQAVAKFMKNRDNFVKSLLIKVPADARNMYVVDEIGNVSTSAVTGRRRVKGQSPFKVMQLSPRYPMAGGWNYTWWHGYSVPLSTHLRMQGSRYKLLVPFIGTIFGSASSDDELPLSALDKTNAAVRDYELHITLPEGASGVEVHVPMEVDSVSLQPFSYYLDSTGRTVVNISTHNVPPDAHLAQVLVEYNYTAASLWQKPVCVALVVGLLFVAASLANRMQFGLKPAQKA
ncbi:dolichyl-diphosphooligosaccharide--protein glycosyltransferase subunit 1 [Coemansia sp. RSA 552]|nr:dolichyl-diphosphooligosaccharide--protein glycosyltransferase subunit 1 [Coemansia sp. RSA 552]